MFARCFAFVYIFHPHVPPFVYTSHSRIPLVHVYPPFGYTHHSRTPLIRVSLIRAHSHSHVLPIGYTSHSCVFPLACASIHMYSHSRVLPSACASNSAYSHSCTPFVYLLALLLMICGLPLLFSYRFLRQNQDCLRPVAHIVWHNLRRH